MNDSTESVNPGPHRVQLRRTKGWRKPDNTVVVARPSKWGNPFAVASNIPRVFVHDGLRVWWETPRSHEAADLARAEAVRLFALHIGPMGNYEKPGDWTEALRGKNLGCWCPLDSPCHADVLLELANREVQ